MQKQSRFSPSLELKASVVATGLALSLVGATSTWAQQAAPTSQAATEKVEKVEVTGSRLPAANLEGASPVTVLDATAIKIDGVRSVENLLNNLPQVFADHGGNVSNGSTGTATVNLRNLGAVRTLVLVNGRRLPAGSPRNGGTAPDLNQVPAPLIKRVEILTGGASAIYGSDAVAGVVNFIMNDRFEGVQVEVNQSFYNHQQQNAQGVGTVVAGRQATNPSQFNVPGDKSSDGKIYDANLLVGANFANGKGNMTAFFNYKKEDALLQSERDFSACSLNATAAGFVCGGSATSFPGRFFLNGGAGPSFTVANAQGGVRPFDNALDQYNFGPTNFFQRPSERYAFNSSINYDISEKAKLYGEFSFHDDHTVAQIAPSGLFGVPVTVFFENPFLSTAWKNTLGLAQAGDTANIVIARRNVEGGGRQDDIRHTSFRTVLGVKGEFGKVWNYDAYMQTAKVIYQETYLNEFSNSRSANALDAVVAPNGNVVCRSVLNGTDPNCIPYNLWSLGQITPAALGYIQVPGFQKGSTEQTVQGGTIAADLGEYGWKMPSAKTGIGVVLGLERRVEKLNLNTDVAFTTGDLAGSGGPTIGVGGKYEVKEYFAEARLPLVEGAQWAHFLNVNGSVRRSDYSTNQKTDSYGFGIEWSPIKQIRTRGSVQRSARAPNVHELFAAQGRGLFNMNNDPCAGATPVATRAQCALTGVSAAQYGNITDSPAGQYNALLGGNPNLRPEKADSNTIGLVFEPTRNFSATLDFFKIKVKDQIGVLPPAITLQQCLAGNPAFCSLITRDSAGTLWLLNSAQVVATNINIASQNTSGFDLGFNYATKLPSYGSLNFNFVGTLLQKFETEPIPGLGSYDCTGLFGTTTCGTPLPEWRHKLRSTWTTPWNVDLSLTWRYLSKVTLDSADPNPLLKGAFFEVDRVMGARNYFDLSASWNVTKQLTLRGGINNLLDKDPPIVNNTVSGAPFGNGNTFPQVYDALGRRVFLNATYKF